MKSRAIILLLAVLMIAAPFAVTAATIVFPTVRTVSPPIPLLTAATAGTSDIVDLHHELSFTSVWVVWNGNCTEGAVEVQAAMSPAGPWVTVYGGTLIHKNALPDWVLLVGSPGALRVTITTPVVGGTVSVSLTGKQ